MRKFILIALAGAAMALVAPQFASATPLSPAGISKAAVSVSGVTEVRWHRRWRRGGGFCWRHPRRC
jgi:hypothetical protein